MARLTVPQGAAPGALDQGVDLGTACDIGALANATGAGLVAVSVRAFNAVGNPITLDGAGMAAHLLWYFSRPNVNSGRRRKTLPNLQPAGERPLDPIRVETGPGVYWVGSPASLYLVGGNPGDVYEVVATQWTPFDDLEQVPARTFERPFEWTLPCAFEVDGYEDLPYVPDFVWGFRVVSGAAQLLLPGGGVIPLPPREKPYALSMGRFQVATGFFEFVGGM